MIRRIVPVLAVLALADLPAVAGSNTATFQAKANVPPNCTISRLADLDFGNYDPLVANATTDLPGNAGVLSIACTRGSTGVTVGLDNGKQPSGTTRQMKTGTGGANQLLQYALYQDSTAATAWDNTSTFAVGATLVDRTAHTLTVYGKVFQNQDVVTGAYSDTVTATINF